MLVAGGPSIHDRLWEEALRRAGILCCLVVLGLLACDRRLDPWVDANAEPPPPERPVRIPALQSPQPREAPGLRAGAPTPAPRTPAPAAAQAPAAAGGPAIRGTLRLADGLAAPAGGVLFVIARSRAAGPPLAVVRLPAGPFPMDFEIGPGDVMIPGVPFAGEIQLTARIDADGDPLTRSPEDLNAGLDGAVRPGDAEVELTLHGGS